MKLITKYKLYESLQNELSQMLIHCKPFIDELKSIYPNKKDFKPLYRGMSELNNKFIFKSNINRQPKHTSPLYHDLFNKHFELNFGWKVRDGVFTTPSQKDASQYGEINIFLPIGNYKYLYSMIVQDLYGEIDVIEDEIIDNLKKHFKKTWNKKLNEDDYFKWIPEIEIDYDSDFDEFITDYIYKGGDKYKEFLNNEIEYYVSTYTNENLKTAINNKVEISFKCDEYYLFPIGMLGQITDLIYLD